MKLAIAYFEVEEALEPAGPAAGEAAKAAGCPDATGAATGADAGAAGLGVAPHRSTSGQMDALQPAAQRTRVNMHA